MLTTINDSKIHADVSENSYLILHTPFKCCDKIDFTQINIITEILPFSLRKLNFLHALSVILDNC
jgi:hypothetical protein